MGERVRRIGVLVPSSDAVVEMDLQRYLPTGVSFHTARLYHSDATKRGVDTLDEIVGAVEPATRSLLQVEPELMVFGCTSGSFYKGYGWDRTLAERIEAVAGVPAVTTSTAVVEALKTVCQGPVFMVTPYLEEINRIEIQFLKDNGIDVIGWTTAYHIALSRDVSNILPRQIVEGILAKRDAVREAEALFISCTGLRAMEVVEELESELNMPVVSANSATLWSLLLRLKIDRQGIGAGRLFGGSRSTARVS